MRSLPDGPKAFLKVLNVIVWIVWACFAVDYVTRLLLSLRKGRFVRTHKLDLLMVLLPMLRRDRVRGGATSAGRQQHRIPVQFADGRRVKRR
jgi:hypothetical protein